MRLSLISKTDLFRVSDSLIEIFLGTVLLASGLLHLSQPYYFVYSASAYQVASGADYWPIILLLPGIQVAAGLCLMNQMLRKGAIIMSAMLFGIFTSVQCLAIGHGREISCGCFGYNTGTIGVSTIILPMICLLLSVKQLWQPFAIPVKRAISTICPPE